MKHGARLLWILHLNSKCSSLKDTVTETWLSPPLTSCVTSSELLRVSVLLLYNSGDGIMPLVACCESHTHSCIRRTGFQVLPFGTVRLSSICPAVWWVCLGVWRTNTCLLCWVTLHANRRTSNACGAFVLGMLKTPTSPDCLLKWSVLLTERKMALDTELLPKAPEDSLHCRVVLHFSLLTHHFQLLLFLASCGSGWRVKWAQVDRATAQLGWTEHF